MAVRIVGVDLPQNKRGEIALTYIFGIGRSAAKTILNKAGIDVNIKVKDWTDAQAARVRSHPATDGYRLLPRHPPSQRPARAWPEHQEQRSHTQRPQENRC